jgi:prepilin-type N-terminal cleavage/methylation domain-containing protein
MKTHLPMDRMRGGFTLIEVIITLSIFLLLAGAVFGIFTATLESVASLQDNQNQSDEVQALSAFLKKSFLDVPAQGTISSFHRDNAPFKVSGIIWGNGDDLRAVDMQLQQNGYYTLRTTFYTPPPFPQGPALTVFQRQVVTNDSTLSWRPLVRDVRAADWRFKEYNSTVWEEQTSSSKPLLAEFTIQLAGANLGVTDDFWIPPTQPAGNAVAAAAANNAAATTGGSP